MRLFTDIIRDLDMGQAVEDLTEELNRIVAAVQDTGKGGELKLSIAIKPPARRDSNAMEVGYTISAKVPKMPAGKTIMFATPSGDLIREDPRQASLPGIREVVDRSTGEVREVG
jgi:hypothetical protein